jgi:hypothetical protein
MAFDSLVATTGTNEKRFYIFKVGDVLYYLMLVDNIFVASGINSSMTGGVTHKEEGVLIEYKDSESHMLNWKGEWM